MANLYTVECDGISSQAEVVGIRGFEGICTLFHFQLWLSLPESESLTVDLQQWIASKITIRVHTEEGVVRKQIHGIVTQTEWLEGSLVRITVDPRLWTATLGRHSTVYVDKAFPDILTATLTKAGLASSDFDLRLSQNYQPIAHVCQYKESHFSFAQRWMEQLGIFWWFEHSDGVEKLVVTDSMSHHQTIPEQPVTYYPTGRDDRSKPESLWAYSLRKSAVSLETRVRDYQPNTPGVTLDKTSQADVVGEGTLVYHTEDDVLAEQDAKRSAKLRAEQLVVAHEHYWSEGRVFDLQSGAFFQLEEHPRLAFNRSYLAVSIEYFGNVLPPHKGSTELREQLGPDAFRVEVHAIRSDTQFRPPRVTPMPEVKGIETGFVDGPADSDYAQIDDRGYYKIRLHLDENNNPAGEASVWLRMLQPHAGAPEGWHFPLRKGTEVMIGFLGGDPDRPVICGAIPDNAHPSVVTSQNHTQNVIHTGGNNRLEIEDNDGQQYIDWSTPPENTFLHLGAHHGSHHHNAIASTNGNGLVHQGGNQDIMVGADKTEEVQKAVKEKYDSTHTVTVKSDVTENYGATQTTVVDGHNDEHYGTQTTIVAGAKVETCASQTTTVSGLLDEQHGSQNTTVNGLLNTTSTTHTMTVSGTSAHFYDSVTYNVGGGGWTVSNDSYMFFDAPNFQVMVPSIEEVEGANRVENAMSSWVSTGPTKSSKDNVKLSIIQTAISAIANKSDFNLVTIGIAGAKVSMGGFKHDFSGLKIEKAPAKVEVKSLGAFFAAIRAWT